MINDNLIINGNFDLWQRGISFSIEQNDPLAGSTTAAPNTKLADRWYMVDTQVRAGGSTGNIQAYREAFGINDSQFPLSRYYMTVANQISGVTQGYCYIENKQENANAFGGIPLTISFYAKNYNSGLTGTTMSCYFRQAIDPNVTEFSEQFSTIQVNPYWEFTSLQFTPRFLANAGLSGEHYFSIGFKLNPQTTVSIAAVKLEFGSSSTTLFTDTEEEKKRQEKYYMTTYPVGTLSKSITVTGGNDITSLAFTVTPNYSYNYKFDQPQYKTPTVSFYSPNTGITSDAYNKTAGKDMRLTSGTRGWNLTTRFSPTGASTLTTTASKYGVVFNVSTGAVVFDDILLHLVADADITPGSGDRGLET
jgi:hypothetical protein